MRTLKFETPNSRWGIEVTYPNAYTYSRTPYSYVKVMETGGVAYGDVELSFYQVEDSEKVDVVTLTRTFAVVDGEGFVLFPISDVLEHYAGDGYHNTKSFNMSLTVDRETFFVAIIRGVIVGVSMTELQDFPSMTFPDFYPRIPIYVNGPEGCITEIPTPEVTPLAKSVQVLGTFGQSKTFGPVTTADHYIVDAAQALAKNIRIAYSYGSTGFYYDIPAYADDKDCGLFVRWRDCHGLMQTFRWEVERFVDEFETESSYSEQTIIDSGYHTRTTDVRLGSRTYTLHSDMMERTEAALPKSIFAARDIEYYDADLSRWVPCRVPDGEIEDDFSPMQDVVVELVAEIQTMTW